MSHNVRASLLKSVPAHQGDVNGISISSKLMATCSSDKTVRLWTLGDFTELACSPLRGHAYHVHCCEFSPFETTLATCSTDGKVILWDTKTFDKIAVLQHPSNQCIRVCRFSSNSCLLATGSDDNTVCLWDVGSTTLLKTMEGHETAVVACAFSPDTSYLVSGSKNGDLRVWDARFDQKQCLYLELDGHDLGVTCCHFSSRQQGSNHQLLTTSGYDNNVKLWLLRDERDGPKLQLHKVLTGHSGPVFACVFSNDGLLIASVSGDKTIRLWNPDTGACLSIFEGHSRYITCCAFSPNRQYLVTGSNDKTVAVWQLLEPGEKQTNPAAVAGPIVDLSDEVEENEENREWVSWTGDQVCSWLDKIGLGLYKELFTSHAIDGQELETLTDSSLKDDIGMKALGHRNKLLRAIKNLSHVVPSAPREENSGTPHEFLCPITCEIMTDPVIVADGYTYEKSAIKAWLVKGSRMSPMTNAPLQNTTLTPNRSLKLAIQRHLQEKK